MPPPQISLTGIINSPYFSLFFGSILNSFAAFRLATLINPSQEKQRTISIPFFVTGTLVMWSKISLNFLILGAIKIFGLFSCFTSVLLYLPGSFYLLTT
jgi:hypothetical protein